MKKKLVVVDLWGSWQHQNINQKYINYLEKIRSIKVIEFNNILKTKGEKISLKSNNSQRNKFINRLQYIYNIIRINKKITKEEEVFILCYDIITFTLFYILNYKKRIVLFQHQHISDAKKKIHNLFFKIYANKVEHIVLEEEFRNKFIKNFKLKKDKVHVCHHSLFPIEQNIETKECEKKCVISISNSYSKEMMKEFLEKIKKINDIKFFIRSLESKVYTRNIISENRKYTLGELKEIYRKGNIVVVMTESKKFENRISGSIFDGLSNGCLILSNDIDIANILKEKYPNIIEIYTSIDDLITKIKDINLKGKKEDFLKDLKKFREDYSDEKITTELRKVFGDKNEE